MQITEICGFAFRCLLWMAADPDSNHRTGEIQQHDEQADKRATGGANRERREEFRKRRVERLRDMFEAYCRAKPKVAAVQPK